MRIQNVPLPSNTGTTVLWVPSNGKFMCVGKTNSYPALFFQVPDGHYNTRDMMLCITDSFASISDAFDIFLGSYEPYSGQTYFVFAKSQ